MNVCKHCGFIGKPEDFKNPNGRVCKDCYRKRQSRYNKKYRKNNSKKICEGKKRDYQHNRERILKQKREYYKDNREMFRERNKLWHNSDSERQKEQYQLNKEEICKQQRKRYENNREKYGHLPWTEIKNLRLGLYIEKVIASLFGVPTETFGTPDIDFTCPNGYKIQVKTASITYSRGNPRWSFKLKKNKVADYFILVAVNNVNDINKRNFKPTHIWLMEGHLLNYKTGTSISLSRISKWDKYSIMEEYESRFTDCCAKIKESE